MHETDGVDRCNEKRPDGIIIFQIHAGIYLLCYCNMFRILYLVESAKKTMERNNSQRMLKESNAPLSVTFIFYPRAADTSSAIFPEIITFLSWQNNWRTDG